MQRKPKRAHRLLHRANKRRRASRRFCLAETLERRELPDYYPTPAASASSQAVVAAKDALFSRLGD